MKFLAYRHRCSLTGAAILLLSGTATLAAPADLAAAIVQQGETQSVETASLEGTRPSVSRRSFGTLYIALGDSFSNGYQIYPFEEGTHDRDNDCQRSLHAYPHRIAENFGLDLSFHSCTGVRTYSFFNDKFIQPNMGQLPQLEYLRDDAALVTFSVGGIDIGLLHGLLECIYGYGELYPGNDCNADFKVSAVARAGFDRLAGISEGPAYIYPLNEVYAEVRRRSPLATVVVVGYPRMFAAKATCDGLSAMDQQWFLDWTIKLNSLIKETAESFGFLYADIFDMFEGHEACQDDLIRRNDWLYPLWAALHPGTLHPNKEGHEAIAQAIEEVLYNNGF
jgi:lysophospholipase L1-like esterase